MVSALRSLLLPSGPGAFRLWLALVVVFHHVTRIEVGKAPVLVFFALSGYWVYRVWTGRYQHTRAPWLTFVVSRWWRIAPVMALSAMLCTGVMFAVGHELVPAIRSMPLRQALSSLFVLGYAQMPARPVGPAWSLDIEMQFYLAAPVLIALARRASAITALFAAFMTYTLGIWLYPELVLTSFLVPFALGILAARHDWTVPPWLGAAGQGLAIMVVAAGWLSPWGDRLLGSADDGWWPMFNIVLAAMLMPQALVSVRSRGGAQDPVWADQSYIVYMLHWPAILLLRAVHWSDRLSWACGVVVLGLGVAALCHLVHCCYDRPIGRLRSRWVEGRRIAAAAPPCGVTKGDDSAPAFA